MWLNPHLSFEDSPELHTNLYRLKKAGGKVQAFAIYIPESVPANERFKVSLEMVEIFYERIVNLYPEMSVVKHKKDVEKLAQGQIGALLTLEGCDAIGQDIVKLKTLLRLGVASVGLTWNYANAVADGILESRGAGLSDFGREIVSELNVARAWTDVSHLSVKGFWDVMELADYPIASHSNCKAIANNPRNLSDDQIKALIERNGIIGVTFVPKFLNNDEKEANITDVLKHIDRISSFGGCSNIGFGSDFDGIDRTASGLEDYTQYNELVELLLKHYSESQVRGFLYQNFNDRLM